LKKPTPTGLAVPYARTSKNEPGPTLARRWLGRKLAARYLEKAGSLRWPQEGLNVSDITNLWRQSHLHAPTILTQILSDIGTHQLRRCGPYHGPGGGFLDPVDVLEKE